MAKMAMPRQNESLPAIGDRRYSEATKVFTPALVGKWCPRHRDG
jgi:hypothetical protein